MAKPFRILREKMSLEAQEESMREANEILAEMRLNELRSYRNMSQEQLAEILETSQANVSRMERRTDMYISTLESYVEALGGHLKIVVNFSGKEVDITEHFVGAH